MNTLNEKFNLKLPKFNSKVAHLAYPLNWSTSATCIADLVMTYSATQRISRVMIFMNNKTITMNTHAQLAYYMQVRLVLRPWLPAL